MKRTGTTTNGKLEKCAPMKPPLKWSDTEAQVAHLFLQFVSEVLDAGAGGERMYLTIGLNMDRTSYLLTWNDDGNKRYAGGASLWALMKEVADNFV